MSANRNVIEDMNRSISPISPGNERAEAYSNEMDYNAHGPYFPPVTTDSVTSSSFGQIQAVTVTYTDTYYIYSFDGKLLSECDQTGSCVRDYIYAGNRLLAEYRTSTGKYYYYMSDQINSTRIITDDIGNVVYSEAYGPYGDVQKTWTKTYDPKQKFSGKEREGYSELDYFGARYFDNNSYRFISVDPVINKTEALSNPQLWNLYAYCANNPITHLDPDGREVWVNARRVIGSLGFGVHTYIMIKPDNPKDFNNEKQWTLSAYGKEINGDKKLVTEKNWKNDAEWEKNHSLKGKFRVKAPNGKTDTQFIKDIQQSFNKYESGSRDYKLFPDVNRNQGNCNTVTSGALIGAGVSEGYMKSLDPSGANPGLDSPLPEMRIN